MNATSIMFHALGDLLVNLAITLVVAVLIAAVLALIRSRDEAANTWKLRTGILTVLAGLALVVPQIWIVMTPLYLVLAWRSYKAGRVVASPPADVVNIGKPALGVFDKFIIFNIILDYWPLPIMRIIKDESAPSVLGKLIRLNIALDYWPIPIFDIFSRLNLTNKSEMAGGVQKQLPISRNR